MVGLGAVWGGCRVFSLLWCIFRDGGVERGEGGRGGVKGGRDVGGAGR